MFGVSGVLRVSSRSPGPRVDAPNSPNALAHPLRERYIHAAATRVAEGLESRGEDRD